MFEMPSSVLREKKCNDIIRACGMNSFPAYRF